MIPWGLMGISAVIAIAIWRWKGPPLAPPMSKPRDPVANILFAVLAFVLFMIARTVPRGLPSATAVWSATLAGLCSVAFLLHRIGGARPASGFASRLGFGVVVWALVGPWLILLQSRYQEWRGYAGSESPQASLVEWTTATGFVRVMMAVALIGLVPWIEEQIFRGWAQPAIAAQFRSVLPQGRATAVAVLVTSLLFASVHPPTVFLAVFLTSLLIGALAVRTRSISAGVAFHAVNNAVALGLSLFQA